MGPLQAEIEIDVSRERAFGFLSDLANRPSFLDHFVSGFRLSRIESSGVGAGARFQLSAPLQSIWLDTTIVEVDEPHQIVERGSGGRSNRIPTHTVWELVDGPGSLVTARVSFWTEPSNPFDRAKELLFASSFWYQRDWREAMRRLRGQLESEGPEAERVGVAGGNRYATGIP